MRGKKKSQIWLGWRQQRTALILKIGFLPTKWERRLRHETESVKHARTVRVFGQPSLCCTARCAIWVLCKAPLSDVAAGFFLPFLSAGVGWDNVTTYGRLWIADVCAVLLVPSKYSTERYLQCLERKSHESFAISQLLRGASDQALESSVVHKRSFTAAPDSPA